MKHFQFLHTIVFMSLSLFSYGQFGQIGNGGFENWVNDMVFENPTYWESSNTQGFYGVACVNKTTDSYNGNYAVKIESKLVGSDTLRGFVFQGTVDQQGPNGGIQYTDIFETIHVKYKCDLNAGDSLSVIVLRYNNGNLVGYNVAPIATGIDSTWTQGFATVGAVLSDELFIGFILNDNASPGSWAIIDEVELLNGSITLASIPNAGFENWDATTVENPLDWYTINDLLVTNGIDNVEKSTDAYAGNYAAELKTVAIGSDTIAGILSKAPVDFSSSVPFGIAPYAGTPTSFSGAYKYSPINNDQAWIHIEFFENGNSCVLLYEIFNGTQTYTTFNSTVTLTGSPDSILFLAFSGEEPGSALLLDALEFGGGNVGLSMMSKEAVSIFPNPAQSIVTITIPHEEFYMIKVTSIDGTSVHADVNIQNNYTFDVSTYPSGIYIISLQNEDGIITERIIVE